MTKKSKVPWLKKNGEMKSIDELKAISKSWSAQTWECYLKTLEVSQKEVLMDAHHAFMALAEKSSINDWYKDTPVDIELFKNRIKEASELFSEMEAKVIRMIFWENKSERAIAQELNVARRSIRTLKGRALQKLNQYFSKVLEKSVAHDVAQYPINEGNVYEK